MSLLLEAREILLGYSPESSQDYLSAQALERKYTRTKHLTPTEKRDYSELKDRAAARRGIHIRRDLVAFFGAFVGLTAFTLLSPVQAQEYFLNLTSRPSLSVGANTVRATSDGSSMQTSLGPEINKDIVGKADQIRQQIRQFEAENADKPVTKETIGQLYRMTLSLYEATFNKKTKISVLTVADRSKSSINIGGQELNILPFVGWRYEESNKPDNSITVVLSKQISRDPDLNPLSVYKALLMRGVVYAQTQPSKEIKTIMVGGEQFSALGTVGLRWSLARGQQKAGFFDELNVQLLAEYLNDPTGRDDLFNRIARSLVYSPSLPPVIVEGGKLLRQVDAGLGITPEEVEIYRYHSQPEQLLARMDAFFIPQRAGRLPPISYTMMRMNPGLFPGTSADLDPLRVIVAQLPSLN